MAAQIKVPFRFRYPKFRIALIKLEHWGVEQIRKVTPDCWTNWWLRHIVDKQVPWVCRHLKYSWGPNGKWRKTAGRQGRAKREAN